MSLREQMVRSHRARSSRRDLDADLLALVTSGYSLDQIVQALGVSLDEIYRRLVRLRLVIEDVSRVDVK